MVASVVAPLRQVHLGQRARGPRDRVALVGEGDAGAEPERVVDRLRRPVGLEHGLVGRDRHQGARVDPGAERRPARTSRPRPASGLEARVSMASMPAASSGETQVMCCTTPCELLALARRRRPRPRGRRPAEGGDQAAGAHRRESRPAGGRRGPPTPSPPATLDRGAARRRGPAAADRHRPGGRWRSPCSSPSWSRWRWGLLEIAGPDLPDLRRRLVRAALVPAPHAARLRPALGQDRAERDAVADREDASSPGAGASTAARVKAASAAALSSRSPSGRATRPPERTLSARISPPGRTSRTACSR